MCALALTAIEHFGRIDVWINNAGIGATGAFDATPIEAHQRVIEADLIGQMNGAHAVLPHFRQRGHGTLINMVSCGGWVAAPYAAAYTASKFGLRGFSEALRAELRSLPGVQVCEVYPAVADTPGLFHGANYTGKRLHPAAPVLDPRQVADCLVALAKTPRDVTAIGGAALAGAAGACRGAAADRPRQRLVHRPRPAARRRSADHQRQPVRALAHPHN